MSDSTVCVFVSTLHTYTFSHACMLHVSCLKTSNQKLEDPNHYMNPESVILAFKTSLMPNVLWVVAVPCRNWRLFRRVFRSHYYVWSAILLHSCCKGGAYMRFMAAWIANKSTCTYEPRPLWKFSDTVKHSDAYAIVFDFYMGLPQLWVKQVCF